MIYNIDFLLASLVFLLVILHHFMELRSMYLANNRSFLWLICCGILNITFDLICTGLITLSSPRLAGLMEFCILILYILQILVPHALFTHILSQFNRSAHGKNIRFILLILLPAMMCALLLANHWTGMFFTVLPDGSYYRGRYYTLMYAFGGIYLIAAAVCSMVHSSMLEASKVRAVLELVFFTGATVVLQSIYHDILLTGFGITLGITVLFFTINNPYRYTDSLTSTFDIRYFRDRSKYYIEHRKRFHIVSVELAQLKRINLMMGVDIGNKLLTTTANMLQSSDKRNMVFRVSGKRFVVITPSIVRYGALRDEIRQFFAKPLDINGEFVSSPVIICGLMDAGELGDSNTLLSYIGYLTGLAANTTETCMIQGDDKTISGFRYNQEIQRYLDTAVEKDLFEVVFQPVYSIKDKKYISLEALSRLRHPSLGPVSPDIFITIAEKNDLISKIGLLQLQKVCRFLVDHPELQNAVQSVKINLSPAELMKPGHAELLVKTIHDFGIPTSFFQFEITETIATEYCEALNQIVGLFTKAGIGLCLDDFGSGYANLNSVMKLPFRIIKLDRSLLFGICYDPRTASLYQSLVNSLHNLGFSIIAEGVETAQEFELVSGWGVDMIQGYYFSRPLACDALLEQLVPNN